MLYTITRSDAEQLDIPVFGFGKLCTGDCAALFTSESSARFFAKHEPDSDELVVAELLETDMLKLLIEMLDQNIASAIVNPRPGGETIAPPAIVNIKELIDGLVDSAISRLTGDSTPPESAGSN